MFMMFLNFFNLNFRNEGSGQGIQLFSPKPRPLRHPKWSWQERVRVNHAIWRSWHMQCKYQTNLCSGLETLNKNWHNGLTPFLLILWQSCQQVQIYCMLYDYFFLKKI